MESLIQQHGYWVILAGTLLEGETVLVLGGFTAHRGYLDLPLVMLVAFAGGAAGRPDQASAFYVLPRGLAMRPYFLSFR